MASSTRGKQTKGKLGWTKKFKITEKAIASTKDTVVENWHTMHQILQFNGFDPYRMTAKAAEDLLEALLQENQTFFEYERKVEVNAQNKLLTRYYYVQAKGRKRLWEERQEAEEEHETKGDPKMALAAPPGPSASASGSRRRSARRSRDSAAQRCPARRAECGAHPGPAASRRRGRPPVAINSPRARRGLSPHAVAQARSAASP